MNTLPVTLLPTDTLIVAPDTERPEVATRDDDTLLKSIKGGGIQQPLVVIANPEGAGYLVVDGTRRLWAAKALALPKVPCVIDTVPEAEAPWAYVRKIRLILDEHRQDLLPSQRAELVVKLQEQKGYTRAQMAQLLGVDSDTVGNYIDVLRYEPEIRDAIDAGTLRPHHARVFRGMSKTGQLTVFRKHFAEISTSGDTAMSFVRSKYPPTQFPSYYQNAAKTAELMNRKKTRRKVIAKSYTAQEKKRLLASVEMKSSELEDNKAEIKTLKSEIEAATPIVAAILRSKKLQEFCSPETLDELKAFGESYC